MNRTEWIIGIVAGILITGIVIAFLIFVTRRTDVVEPMDHVAAVRASDFAGTTSMQAYELVKEKAAQWQPDALLIKVNTTWPQGTTREDLLSGARSWNLGFYSPNTSSAANIEVLHDQAKLVNEFDLKQSVSPEEVSQWRIDSTVAIYRLLDEGGDNFLDENGISTLTMSLTNDEQSDRLEWLLLLLGTQASNTLIMRLDASTGEVLETIVSS